MVGDKNASSVVNYFVGFIMSPYHLKIFFDRSLKYQRHSIVELEFLNVVVHLRHIYIWYHHFDTIFHDALSAATEFEQVNIHIGGDEFLCDLD